jgi:hypothetical protein
MRNILFSHRYTTKYVLMNGIRKTLKAYLHQQLHGDLQDLQDRGYLDQI